MKHALVISGGGSKGAFAGGVAQYLIEEEKINYDLFIGTSTGSLLVSHLALGKLKEIKKAFTAVNQTSIFSVNPFIVKKTGRLTKTKINHFSVLMNFLKGRKTFGQSDNLRKLIQKEISQTIFEQIKQSHKEVVVCVSNFTLNSVEYKTLDQCKYDDFVDWIWISCNYVPFMSLVIKNRHEYADGGFGCIIAIEEAIKRGATHVDAIILTTEYQHLNRMRSRNAFDVLISAFEFMSDQIEKDNVKVGKLIAREKGINLRTFYTPKVLTTNSLVFDLDEMNRWWTEGWEYAQSELTSSNNPKQD